MENYLSNFNDPIYKEYLNKLQYVYSYKVKILKKEQDETRYYKENAETIELKYNSMHIVITKPKYKDIFKEIELIKKEKKELLVDYNNLQYKILHDLNNQTDFKNYKETITKLKELDNKVKEYLEYYIKINEMNRNEYKENLKKRNDIKTKKIELYEDILQEQDSILNKKRIIDYLNFGNQYYSTFDKTENLIDYVIVKLPEIEEKNIIKKKVKKEIQEIKPKLKKTDEEIEKEKRSKLKKKIKKKLNSKSQQDLNKLEKEVKDKFLKLFIFKNEKECSDKKRTAEHYMKKPEIIDIIKRSKDIEKRLPENYKTLSKPEICKEIFKL
tara:strand:+ start:274 stop:1254 length:981 start_codon:yes stop_codon:yes gene_type:complete